MDEQHSRIANFRMRKCAPRNGRRQTPRESPRKQKSLKTEFLVEKTGKRIVLCVSPGLRRMKSEIRLRYVAGATLGDSQPGATGWSVECNQLTKQL